MYNIVFSFAGISLISPLRKDIVWHIVFLCLAFIFSTRNELIPDTENYIIMYDSPFAAVVEDSTEWGFRFLCILFNFILSVNIGTFFFVVTFFLMELWFWTTKKFLPNESYGFLFLLFVCYNGFFYLGIPLRNVISLIITYYALFKWYDNEGKKNRLIVFIVYIILAMLFHRTAFMFLVLPLMKAMPRNSRFLTNWLLLDMVFLLLNGASLIGVILGWFSGLGGLDKFEDEASTDHLLSSRFSIWFFLNLANIAFMVWGRDKVNNMYKKLFDMFCSLNMVGLTLYCLGWQMLLVTRMAGSFFFFNFIPLYLLLFDSSLFLRNKVLQYFVTIVVSIINFSVLIYCQSTLLFY